jgi:1,4-alpha-glucan branching enzyme
MRVRFSVEAPEAKKVLLAGDFTDWQAHARAMRKASPRGRRFSTTLTLKPGNYQYKFIVDGRWITDPKAEAIANPFGTHNSVVTVSS